MTHPPVTAEEDGDAWVLLPIIDAPIRMHRVAANDAVATSTLVFTLMLPKNYHSFTIGMNSTSGWLMIFFWRFHAIIFARICLSYSQALWDATKFSENTGLFSSQP